MAKILLIEDDVAIIKVYSQKLELAGYEVDLAKNSTEGIEKALADTPDLVLLDIAMPGGDGAAHADGFNMMKKMSQHINLKKVPVIVISNSSSDIHMATARDKGAVEYLIKANTSVEDLVTRIKNILSGTENV